MAEWTRRLILGSALGIAWAGGLDLSPALIELFEDRYRQRNPSAFRSQQRFNQLLLLCWKRRISKQGHADVIIEKEAEHTRAGVLVKENGVAHRLVRLSRNLSARVLICDHPTQRKTIGSYL